MFASNRVGAISRGLGIAALCLTLTLAWAGAVPEKLVVQVSGFTHARGHAIANLFREGGNVLKADQAYLRASAEIHDGSATVTFADLVDGKYAVVVFHDENDNGTLDHNFMRLPAEPLGNWPRWCGPVRGPATSTG